MLRAVQGVSGVREATLRKNADGLHTLRLELLFDEADPGRVSRAVARLLDERIGLAAEPNLPDLTDLTPPAQRAAARRPGATRRTARYPGMVAIPAAGVR